MNTIAKVGILTALIGLVVWGVKAAKKAVSEFQFEIVAYGKPSLSNMILTVPFRIRFFNPTPLPISVDQMIANIYLYKDGNYVHAATINQPVTIAAGESFDTITPVVNLASVFGGSFQSTLNTIAQIANSGKIKLLTRVKVVKAGITFPEQEFSNEVSI